jgi:phosphatidate cytidylyltransferase
VSSDKKSSAGFSDLGVRSLSALALVPLALLDVWAGGIWFQMFAGCLGILMAFELQRIAGMNSDTQFALLVIGVLVAAFLPAAEGQGIALMVVLGLWLVANLVLGGKANFWHRFALGYVSLPVLALVVLRNSAPDGLQAVVFTMLLVWSADTLAYFAGRIIGGPKLAPRLSPKKTWAGLGGAICGAVIVALAFQVFWRGGGFTLLPLLAAVLALVEQAGDILESSLKRRFGVKDSGTMIPGHGGVLDRIDGLMAVAAVAALAGWLMNAAQPATGLFAW